MNSAAEQSSISKSGWVKKKTTSGLKLWKPRFLSLEGCKLKYFHNELDPKPAGLLDFNVLTINVSLDSNDFALDISGCKRRFRFRCDAEQVARDWVYAIMLSVQRSLGAKVITPVSSKEKFWKHDRISLTEFEEEVQTGDLLLFKGNSALSKMQRAVTRGNYDHVALLVKSSSGNIFLFEVTGVEGVAMLLWSDFMLYQWHKLYSMLTYRKVVWDRNEAAVKKLNEFILSTQGMDYSLSARKLLRRKADKEIKDKKGFFCSELIATALKECGLIGREKPSSKYWPGDFDDGRLQMIPPARVENGKLIDFDLG